MECISMSFNRLLKNKNKSKITINGKKFDCFLDTGSLMSFIDRSCFEKNFPYLVSHVQNQKTTFSSVAGNNFLSSGVCSLSVTCNEESELVPFHIIDTPMKVILGVDALTALSMSFDFRSKKLKPKLCSNVSNSVNILDKVSFLSLFNYPKNITSANSIKLKELLWEYRDVFSTNDYDLGKTNCVEHSIETSDSAPIHCKQFRLPYSQKQAARQQLEQMLDNKVIEEANSPWNSPFFFVKKKDGSDRFVVDYRKLNEVTVKDRMPIPHIEELLDNLSQSTIFSTVDLTSGYWQVPLSYSAKEKTAFSLDNNQYQFQVMPFGLANAPATFQRLMMGITRDFPTTPYLDDIVVASESIEENLI